MDRLLNELLKDSFNRYQVLFNQGRFHSHTSHHLGSLVLLGADEKQLEEVYENISRRYSREYEPSPHDINDDNWHKSIGDAKFCSAYQNYFETVLSNENWQEKFFEILLDDSHGVPLIDAVYSSILHPIIHIHYAIELNNRYVACEALTMTTICADSFANISNKLQAPSNGTKQPIEILKEIYSDENAPASDRPFHGTSVFENEEDFLMKYYNQWKIPNNIDETIEQLFDMSVYLYGATHTVNDIGFSFVLLHLLTGANAIRKIQSNFDEIILRKLLHAFFYLTLGYYIARQQPLINEQLIDGYEVENEKLNWKYVIDKTLNTKLAAEPHAVKVIRALRDAEQDYGLKNHFYLKTAVKTVDNLNVDIEWDYYKSVEPWIGGPRPQRRLNIFSKFSTV